MHALPHVVLSDEALLRLVGFNAQQVRQGICQRGVTKRPGARPPGPLGADPLAKNIVKLHLRALEALFHGAMRALANAGVCGAKVTGIADGTDLQTTEPYTGGGRVPRNVRLEEKRGRVHEMEVSVYGWKILLLIDAVTKIPLAVKGGPIAEHGTHGTRAAVTQAQANRGDRARDSQHGRARGCPGPGSSPSGEHARSPGAYGPPRARKRGPDGTAGDGGRGDHGAHDR
jgi:hypothetical protein